jgi:hypothetical protein
MLKKTVISLSAVAFILVAGTSFATSLNSTHLMNGKTTKAEVISMLGEPNDKSNDKFIYQEDSVRLDVSFKNDVVSSSHQNNDNN